MPFLDASFVVALAFQNDTNHEIAVQFAEDRKNSTFYLSPIAICEIACVIPRKIVGGNLISDPVSRILQQQFKSSQQCSEALIYAVLSYLSEKYRIKFCSDNEVAHFSTVEPLGSDIFQYVEVLNLYKLAIKWASTLMLKSLDMLELVYVKKLSETGRYPAEFVTLDIDFAKRQQVIKDKIGIQVECSVKD